jgi:hypothetical protein
MKKIILFIVMALSSCCTIFGADNSYFGADNSYQQTIGTVVFQQFPEGMAQFSALFKDEKQVKQILNLLHLRKTVIEKLFVESSNKAESMGCHNLDNIYSDNEPKFRQATKSAYEQAELAYSQADDIVKKCLDYIETFFEDSLHLVLRKSIQKRPSVIGQAILTYNSIRTHFAINGLPELQDKKLLKLSSPIDLSKQLPTIAEIYMARDEYKLFINMAYKFIVGAYPHDKTSLPTAVFEFESKLLKNKIDQCTHEQIANLLHLATLCKAKKELIQHLQTKGKREGSSPILKSSTHRGSDIVAKLKAKVEQTQPDVLLPILKLETITEQDIINQVNASQLEPAIKSELLNIISFDISYAVKMYLFKIQLATSTNMSFNHILELRLVPDHSIEEEAAKYLKNPDYLKKLLAPIAKKTTASADTKQPIQEQPKQNPTKKKKHKKRQAQKQTVQKASTSTSSSSSSSAPSSPVSSSTISTVKETTDTNLEKQLSTPPLQETPTTQKADGSKQEAQQTKNDGLDTLKPKELEPVATKPNDIQALLQQLSNLQREVPAVTNSSSSSSSSSQPSNPEQTVQLPLYFDHDDIASDYPKFGHILDLERGQQGGYQNQVFIIKRKKLPENYLAKIRYSQEVLGKMMALNDNNHSFSPLVEKMFGQFATECIQTPVDQNSAEFKKGFKYKYEIKNDGVLASLGCPFNYISYQINNGASIANGQFEFIVLYNPDTKESYCLHRFFRPYR